MSGIRIDLFWHRHGLSRAQEWVALCEYHFQFHAAMCLNFFRLASVVFPEDDLVFFSWPSSMRRVDQREEMKHFGANTVHDRPCVSGMWYDIRTRTRGSTGKGQSTHVHQIASLPELGAAECRQLLSACNMQVEDTVERCKMECSLETQTAFQVRMADFPGCQPAC